MPPKKMSEGDVKELLTGLESRLEEKFADLKNDLLSIKNTVIQRLVDENKKPPRSGIYVRI